MKAAFLIKTFASESQVTLYYFYICDSSLSVTEMPQTHCALSIDEYFKMLNISTLKPSKLKTNM